MTPADLAQIGLKLYGRKYWKARMAAALDVDVSTIHRMMHRPQLPGPYVVALNALMENKRQQDVLEAAARKLLPRKLRKRLTPRKKNYGRRLIPYAGSPDLEPSE